MTNSHSRIVSVVIRSLNEEKWLAEAIDGCRAQKIEETDVEIVLVDSGSTDRTLDIAKSKGCRIVHIDKHDFTFGRSLNYGCAAATGDVLVFISAHCIPATETWLANLVGPIISGNADYVHGRQIGHELTKFSEHQVFAQYFPAHEKTAEENGSFANNANAALLRSVWEKIPFDEDVTGLEDMVLGKALVASGGTVAYAPDAPVIHIHEESFRDVRRRYYREALTLREIMPEVHFHFSDFLRFFCVGVLHDFSVAMSEKKFARCAVEIVAFRFMQYWGTYRGHNEHRILSRAQKESYYYPRPKTRPENGESERRTASTHVVRPAE
jgi:rhamnosyltransferase